MNDQEHPDPIDALVDSLFAGDDIQAKEHLRTALADVQRANTLAHVDAIIESRERESVTTSALREFERGHPSIATDPAARQVADQFLGADLQRHGFASMGEVPIDQIGTFVDRAGESAERFMRDRVHEPASDPSSVIERMRAARTGQAQPS